MLAFDRPAGDGERIREAADRLSDLLSGHTLVALTGAGMSTESGIPDYRGRYKSTTRAPIQHRDFLRDPAVRRRYWARAFVGFRHFNASRPNPAHEAVAALEKHGLVDTVITQNVDRLHHAAGSERVIELHGALAEVRCLGCHRLEPRDGVQERLYRQNPSFDAGAAMLRPDGDAEIADGHVDSFKVPECLACGGVLKPNVVFFGDSVPRDVVETAFAAVDRASALLVLGTSLTVFSGFRFVRRAHEAGKLIVIVNHGETRGDSMARLCIDASLGTLLPELVTRLVPDK